MQQHPYEDGSARETPGLKLEGEPQLSDRLQAALPYLPIAAARRRDLPLAALVASVAFLAPPRRLLSLRITMRMPVDLVSTVLLLPHLTVTWLVRLVEFALLRSRGTVRFDGRFLLVLRPPERTHIGPMVSFFVLVLAGTGLFSEVAARRGWDLSQPATAALVLSIVLPFMVRGAPAAGRRALRKRRDATAAVVIGDFARVPWSRLGARGVLRRLLACVDRRGIAVAGLARPALLHKVYVPAGFSRSDDAFFSRLLPPRLRAPVYLIHNG